MGGEGDFLGFPPPLLKIRVVQILCRVVPSEAVASERQCFCLLLAAWWDVGCFSVASVVALVNEYIFDTLFLPLFC